MQLNNQYQNNSFTGAFRFRPSEKTAQILVPELFTQGRQIFTDIVEKGDMVIVVRDNYDKRIGRYIKTNGVTDVEYMPTLNTKCGLDSQEPEKLIDLLKSKTHAIITDFDEMFKVIKKQKLNKSIKGPHEPQKLDPNKEFERITNSLRLNIEKPKMTIYGQYFTIRDDAKQRTVEAICNSGIYYVFIKPDAKYAETLKFMIDGKGNIIKQFEEPNEIHKFYKEFTRLKAENAKKQLHLS